jgi:hypothetical protein
MARAKAAAPPAPPPPLPADLLLMLCLDSEERMAEEDLRRFRADLSGDALTAMRHADEAFRASATLEVVRRARVGGRGPRGGPRRRRPGARQRGVRPRRPVPVPLLRLLQPVRRRRGVSLGAGAGGVPRPARIADAAPSRGRRRCWRSTCSG